ncbi:bifunctional pantoate--beta-alanine ligase/(d)CMP kinase [Synechococcus sp. Cruz-9H2]|uniref:bifunctional pantoate--beta-alanine ligase/(d)CMP kinase n=1 Tax=unclassified Synechococcus TaxID=2626047 RepID=UPI0020CFD180|nr:MULTISPECIES: bifunctional pantoate--beta-alanine ligase/(d)CMP kinase [unclassified Synechococcus]MCP9819041.1 bifunctional pantoate--beta-alanine ligase/(d)CMP kinase [Synechococcus sp. Cruz-9H2]MCP9843545.1 bifunctional pantoate--beta-alanine ligase/(d)CMP kinase [Synechococcus sp. Edmonson 11F2]MCP9855073.1 bifunctional pantoate--beta-alanine ligase/(d)CMP kinase [Synechococcus sp. Cruz-9C9]MCP9862955.1 bifunctional pantoate--beta-alanine ligase/(d)CMP kinase [Synechococcus sp. Cruz-7E5]
MQLLHTCDELRRWCRPAAGRRATPLHFVPTMGALHQGHRSLIERASASFSSSGPPPRVLVSVFVNPLQFGPGEDFERYPRDPLADGTLAAAAGATALFAPSVEELFPGGDAELTRVLPPPSLLQGLCARTRVGHFEGVATVVARLLALVQPDRLLLGEKDWQQLVILRRIVADLALPVRVQGCATWRESDGLAASSRNRYLSKIEREQAAGLPAALAIGRRAWQSGERDPARLERLVQAELEQADLAVEYVEMVEARRLRPLNSSALPQGPLLLAAAVRCGPSRLIDHLVLMNRPPIVAIDGPAGAGKSTVTRDLARRLGLIYLDTGAMYRAVTWWVLRHGANPAVAAEVEPLLQGLELSLDLEAGGDQQVRVNGHDVTQAIRHPDVTAQVSQVAAHGCVREALTQQQRALGARGRLVAEGRDIGTAVFPDADLKVFLTATVAERARRRAQDLEQRGFAVPSLAELEALITERDRQDSTREVAPLLQAEDAVELITDGLAIEEVITTLVDLFRERIPEEAWPAPENGAAA